MLQIIFSFFAFFLMTLPTAITSWGKNEFAYQEKQPQATSSANSDEEIVIIHTATPTNTARFPVATPQVQIECVGPDGVHFMATQKDCDGLSAFWKNPNVTPTPTSNAWDRWAEGRVTWLQIPADDHMSSDEELFIALNAYRRAQSIAEIAWNDVLCRIARERVADQVTLGRLDDHAGFPSRAQSQREFRIVSEVLFGGTQPVSGVHIVEYGWDRSLTGHREAIQDRTMTHGCGAVSGYFAVFVFGGN